MFLIAFTTLIITTALLWSTAVAQEPTPTATPEPTSLPTEMTEGGIQGFSSSGVSGCTENECIFYVEDGTDDAGPIIPYPPVGSCNYSTNANEIYIGECPDGEAIVSGLRVPGITIPEGARIAYAYLEFTVDGMYSNNILVNIYGEAAADPHPFGEFPERPDDRQRTSEFVGWLIPNTDEWHLSQTRVTPDLTPVLLEIIDQGWQDGNAMVFVLESVALGQDSDPDPAKRHRRFVGVERPPETYDGEVARLVIGLASPPPHSISRYWDVYRSDRNQLDHARLYATGCNDAKEHREEYIVVILDFGDPELRNGRLGANLPATGYFFSIDEIKRGVKNYISGYWDCSKDHRDSYLMLGIGTNNQGIVAFYDAPAADHGAAWGQMIEDLHDWLINEQCTMDEFYVPCNYRRQITVVGASDIEDWGEIENYSTGELEQVKPESARAWADAYSESAPTKPYINYGNCSNCETDCGNPDYPWCNDHYWYLSWGNKNAWPLPEIYREDGRNAEQWQALSKYSATCTNNCEPENTLFHTPIFFRGSLTQEGCCDRRDCEPGTANPPKDGWEQLFDELFKDPVTRQVFLRWSTDILWESDLLKEE
jgi:hypothetical protein